MVFVKRLLSGIVIVVLTVSAMFFYDPFFSLFLVLIGTMMAWEWEQMLQKRTGGLSVIMPAVSASVVFLTTYSYPLWALLVILLTYIGVYTYLRKSGQVLAGFTSFGILYVNLPLFSLALISAFFSVSEFHEYAAFLVLLWIFLTVWASDTGGFIFGHLLHGPKLAPKISPNKTWSGFFGGIILSIIVTSIYLQVVPLLPNIMTGYGYILEEPKHIQRYFLMFTAIVSVISQIGDLFESWIKRKLEIKDSGNLIPGHGGAFDRFDGLFFVSVFVAVAMIIYWIRFTGTL